MKKSFHNKVATFLGILTALANSWITIDWANFNIHKEWPKLVLSAIIGLGGYFTTLNNNFFKSKFNGPNKPKQDSEVTPQN